MSDDDRPGDVRPRFDVSDRVYVITGGAGLLGAAYAHALGHAGAHAVIADIDIERAKVVADEVTEETGQEPLPVELDVTDPESVAAMGERVLERFGRLDGLVNNAALDPKFDQESAGEHTSKFEEFPLDAWRRALDVNVTGMFLAARELAPIMLDAGKGVIVNISSTYGLVGPDQRLYQREGRPTEYKPVTYTVSKAAVLGLTRYLASYYAGSDLRVNTLTPGGVYADHDDEFVERYSARTVLGRMGDREEMSAALLFLLSDASSYMTGANLVVDGGWTAW